MSAPIDVQPAFFLDSSAAVKIYLREAGSGWMQAIGSTADDKLLALAHI